MSRRPGAARRPPVTPARPPDATKPPGGGPAEVRPVKRSRMFGRRSAELAAVRLLGAVEIALVVLPDAESWTRDRALAELHDAAARLARELER